VGRLSPDPSSYNPLKGYRNRLRFISYFKLGGALPHPFFRKESKMEKAKEYLVRIEVPGFDGHLTWEGESESGRDAVNAAISDLHSRSWLDSIRANGEIETAVRDGSGGRIDWVRYDSENIVGNPSW